MRMMNGPGNDGDDPRRGSRIGGHRDEPPVEAGSLNQLHAEEITPLVLTDLVDRHDVRVVELGNRFGLILKSQSLGFRGKRSRLDQFERRPPG